MDGSARFTTARMASSWAATCRAAATARAPSPTVMVSRMRPIHSAATATGCRSPWMDATRLTPSAPREPESAIPNATASRWGGESFRQGHRLHGALQSLLEPGKQAGGLCTASRDEDGDAGGKLRKQGIRHEALVEAPHLPLLQALLTLQGLGSAGSAPPRAEASSAVISSPPRIKART